MENFLVILRCPIFNGLTASRIAPSSIALTVGGKHCTPPPLKNSTDTFNTVSARIAELMNLRNWSQKKCLGSRTAPSSFFPFPSSWKDLTAPATTSAVAIFSERRELRVILWKSPPHSVLLRMRRHVPNFRGCGGVGYPLICVASHGERPMQRVPRLPPPPIFSASGRMGPSFYKRLADLLSEKWDVPYSEAICIIRCRLSFALLRSAIRCMRGSRSTAGRPAYYNHPDNSEVVLSETALTY